MGGSSVPSSTAQYQQLATGIWGSPQATKLALPILKPALANIKNQQDMLMGFQKGDPEQTRKFLGLPEGASSEETLTALNRANNPVTSQVQYQPPAKTAAHGGIMSLDDEPQRDPRRGYAPGGAVKPLTPAQRQAVLKINKAIEAGTVTDAQRARLDKIEKNTGLNVSPYSETGTGTPKNPKIAASVDSAGKAYQASPAGQEKTALQATARQEGLAPSDAYINEAGKFGFDPDAYKKAIERGDLAGVTTNPLYSEAIRQLQGMQKQPEQFGQATGLMSSAADRLMQQAGYTPQQIQAQQATGAGDVSGATMTGPQSWTQAGTAQQYMNPYVETALRAQQRLANQQFAQQQNQLRSQAAGRGAFGGSASALAEQAAQLNQNITNENLAAQGLSSAYGQGMQQFLAEQNLGQQAKQANIASLNQAALANQLYGVGGLQSQLANQQAALQAATQNQQAGLTGQGLNLQAINQAGLFGQGLGALGSQIGNYNSNLVGMFGNAGGTLQGLGSNWYNQQTQNAGNVWGGPTNLGGQGVGVLGGMGGGQSGTQVQTAKQG